MEKNIKINKPMPEAISQALREKQEFKEKVQSGEIKLKSSQKGLTVA
ncbi:hypothetical protein [Dyadobacter sp. CY323]|nr:hypothetical protein [Dyadobacter sp. CY323]MCE6993035.1 hypothetical protein [Dyadobacter sp. CY323]